MSCQASLSGQGNHVSTAIATMVRSETATMARYAYPCICNLPVDAADRWIHGCCYCCRNGGSGSVVAVTRYKIGEKLLILLCFSL